ncbi:hypothetical protein IGS68_33580 (plasmid) [Skermanella sp. TT6]|uniref:Uncharacterized protein n=1 Tax=Skermanella cutis TaxID=2775420 RepID=A0ABX7BGR1_9PROT|nr:hypothetical protein [Skermanella sp. TT6]QQP93554.1 hypothetical protein IGS68_33580 [Skermanella sp. TT6]
MTITTMDQLVTALSRTHQELSVLFLSGTTAAGGHYNLNRHVSLANSWGTAAVVTAASDIMTGDAPGYPSLTAPAAGQTLYIARANLTPTNMGAIMIYDRIWARGGFVNNSTAAQAVTSFPALPSTRAPSGGEGLEIWIEGQTTSGSTATNATISYVNSAGVDGRTTPSTALITSFGVGRMQRIPFQEGDTGVSAINSVTLSAANTAGAFAITLLKRKCMIPLTQTYTGNPVDFAGLGLPAIDQDACLQFVLLPTTTTSGLTQGTVTVVAG